MDLQDKRRAIQLLEKQVPFLAYALPGQRGMVLIENTDSAADDVYFSFFGKDAPVFRLSETGSCRSLRLEQTSKPDYADALSHIVGRLKASGGKTVLSRIIKLDVACVAGWPVVLDNLFDKADINSFRFIFYMPQTGLWLGASPELLLKMDADGRVSTMALAGTRRARTEGGWDAKNQEEHRLVVDYIVQCFRESGFQPRVSEAQTVTHGELQHLRHEITASPVDTDTYRFDQLLSRLNPTPALAGWPVDEALSQIAGAERCPRYCYGGYISLRLADGSRVAYVNLRSCYYSGDGFYLYCGGGLTAQSELESEWDETVLKSTAMRAVLGCESLQYL